MSQSEENKFENEWRRAFDEAAETPPDGVWSAIERRLDEEDDQTGILPLWRTPRPWAYGIAAALAVLLVGWWMIRSSVEPANSISSPQSGSQATGQIAQQKDQPRTRPDATLSSPGVDAPGAVTSKASGSSSLAENRSGDRSSSPATSAAQLSAPSDRIQKSLPESVAAHSKSEYAGRTDNVSPVTENRAASENYASRSRSSRQTKSPDRISAGNSPETMAVNRQPDRTLLSQPQTLATQEAAAGDAANAAVSPPPTLATAETAGQRLSYQASTLQSKPVTSRRNPQPDRIVWFRPAETALSPRIERASKKEYWAALTATPLSFNPGTSLTQQSPLPMQSSALIGSSFMQNRSSAAPAPVDNQAQLSIAYQASAGLRVSKHWTVETGVQYLQARSQARNSASVMNTFTNQAENSLVSAIRNSGSTNASYNSAADNLVVSSPTIKSGFINQAFVNGTSFSETVSNDFQYLQIPLQAGYHIRPDHRLSYAVLGGLLANVFLQNTVGSLDVKPSDAVYRPLLLAGTAGLRLNYRPTGHWSGSVTGSFQRALQSGTRSGALLTTRPQAMGVGFGLNYHF